MEQNCSIFNRHVVSARECIRVLFATQLVCSLYLYDGQFVGYLNENNVAGWSSTVRLNYGPVLARYIKLDSFTFRVRLCLRHRLLAYFNACASRGVAVPVARVLLRPLAPAACAWV